jgi:hypothetical protein
MPDTPGAVLFPACLNAASSSSLLRGAPRVSCSSSEKVSLMCCSSIAPRCVPGPGRSVVDSLLFLKTSLLCYLSSALCITYPSSSVGQSNPWVLVCGTPKDFLRTSPISLARALSIASLSKRSWRSLSCALLNCTTLEVRWPFLGAYNRRFVRPRSGLTNRGF